jgi:flagellar basal-body rod modification protein FlgD
MTSDVTLTGAVNNAQKTQNQQFKLGEDFSQFLTLLTTQLQNQDPLNPMDSSEFTNQLVQFSQVEQAINTNQKLDDLVGMQLANLPAFATNYVGLDATYQGSDMAYDGTSSPKINYALDRTAVVAKVNIYDEEGGLVYTHNVPLDAGKHEFTWDGSNNFGGHAPAGTYNVQISAFDGDNKGIQASTAVTGRVRGVETQNGMIFLLIGERAVPLGNVINATQPEEPPAAEEESGA